MPDAFDPIVVNLPLHHLVDRTSPARSIHAEISTRLDRFPAIAAAFESAARDSDWLVFMFDTLVRSRATYDPTLNLQYSVEDGALGLDWVLLGERNRVDRQRIERFARMKRHTVRERRLNDVFYLRVEDGDLVALGIGIARELYRVPEDYVIGVLSSCDWMG